MTALESRAARNDFRNALAHAKTKRGRLDARAIHVEPSDGGAGANAIRAAIEPEPLWRTLWRRERAGLPPTGRRVLDALLVDWRTAPAAKIAAASRPTVDHWKKLFQKIFAQCFQAWERDFGQK